VSAPGIEHALLGRTGVRVSRLALGTMSFGGDADAATSAALFAAARDAGVNFIDTADVYNQGRSEELLAELIAPCRDQLVLASKAYFPTGPDGNARGTSRYHLVRAVEGSLRRLRTDRLDVFYLHRWDDLTAIDETLRAVEDLIRAGKILYPACSNFAAWQVAHALGVADRLGLSRLCAIQPMYNLGKRQVESEILPMAQALGVGVVTYSPTGGGLFTGKYGVGRAPASGRLLSNKMYQTRYADPALYAAADRFTTRATELGVPPAQLAVAWVLANPAVTSVLLGARDVTQLRQLLAAGAPTARLDPALYAELSALTPTPPPATDRNEERSSHNFGAR
jgi:aryl-alcohol dehydrogenase-like predicted oxidoreductase